MSKTKGSKKEAAPVRVITKSESSNQAAMKTSEIRDLIDFISKSGLNEVSVETKELKLHVKREPDQKVFKSTPVVAPMAATPVAAASAPAAASAQAPAAPKAEKSSGKKTLE